MGIDGVEESRNRIVHVITEARFIFRYNINATIVCCRKEIKLVTDSSN